MKRLNATDKLPQISERKREISTATTNTTTHTHSANTIYSSDDICQEIRWRFTSAHIIHLTAFVVDSSKIIRIHIFERRQNRRGGRCETLHYFSSNDQMDGWLSICWSTYEYMTQNKAPTLSADNRNKFCRIRCGRCGEVLRRKTLISYKFGHTLAIKFCTLFTLTIAIAK